MGDERHRVLGRGLESRNGQQPAGGDHVERRTTRRGEVEVEPAVTVGKRLEARHHLRLQVITAPAIGRPLGETTCPVTGGLRVSGTSYSAIASPLNATSACTLVSARDREFG